MFPFLLHRVAAPCVSSVRCGPTRAAVVWATSRRRRYGDGGHGRGWQRRQRGWWALGHPRQCEQRVRPERATGAGDRRGTRPHGRRAAPPTQGARVLTADALGSHPGCLSGGERACVTAREEVSPPGVAIVPVSVFLFSFIHPLLPAKQSTIQLRATHNPTQAANVHTTDISGEKNLLRALLLLITESAAATCINHKN